MEAHLSSTVEDGLLESLNFRPSGQSAAYVLESRQVRFFAEASDRLGPNSRVIRFRLVDQGFWEPASSRIQFTLNNKDSSNALVPISGPLGMFSRCRIFISGIQVENLDFVGESNTLVDRLKSPNRRQNDSIEHHLLTSGTGDTYMPIPANGSRKVMMTVPAGSMQMEKWIPLNLVSGGFTVELELNADSGAAFDTTNTPNWVVTDVSMLCNIHTVDSSLSNSYAKHILSGNSINYHTKSMVVTKHLITDSTFTIPIVRGFSRLCQCYLTLHKGSSASEKGILDFYSLVNNQNVNTTSDVASYQLTIGSRRFPERPIDFVSEQYYRLRETAGVLYMEKVKSVFCRRIWLIENHCRLGLGARGASRRIALGSFN